MSGLPGDHVVSTGIGSWPGEAYADAVAIAFAESPELPYLPEQPARGTPAGLVGRTTAVLTGLAVDLQPAGWRLTDAPGRDHRRARAQLRDDLERLEEQAQDYAGPFKLAFAGPWTLAASVERPRGDRVLADVGARRDLGQSLAQGLADLLAELCRRLPALQPVLQLDEPLLPAVARGSVPTASGFGTHRVVDLPELSGAVSGVVDAVTGGLEVPVWVHSCAAGMPLELLRRAGVVGFALDQGQLTSADWDVLGAGVEQGLRLVLGVLPTDRPDRLPGPDRLARRALGPLRELGLDPELLVARVTLAPACGLAGWSVPAAVRALRELRSAAGLVTEQLRE